MRRYPGRELLGWWVGLLVRVWLSTLRLRVHADPALDGVADRPWVLAFWHGTQWPLLAWRRRRATVVLVSLSRDGALQSRALAAQGLRVVRGSSSRGGARGLVALVRVMRAEGADAAFAVDGPRGPAGVAKEGALAAARATGGVVVPMGSAVDRGVVLGRAWDRFAVAWPFTRASVVLGAPLLPRQGDSSTDLAEPAASQELAALEASLRRANDAARALLERPREVPAALSLR